jgi:hypothetical protein
MCTPGLTIFDPELAGRNAVTVLADGCTVWLEDVARERFDAVRLAPPILETWAAGGRLVARGVVDLSVDWPLPVASGVE